MERGLFSFLLLSACTSGTPLPPPQQWSLAALIQQAKQGGAYVPSLENPDTQIPWSAVVTPPGADVFFSSTPYTATTVVNSSAAPVLNVLPAVVEGRFGPYVTIEAWTNDFGPVWYNPLFRMVQDDGTGAPVVDPMTGKIDKLTPDVYTVAPPDRFYSPFWALQYVVVPASDVANLKAHPPKSTRDVLDLGYPQVAGPNGVWPIVPSNVTVAPALQPPAMGAPRADPSASFPPWMKVIARAEYTTVSLEKMSTLSVSTGATGSWWEGQPISTMAVGLNNFVDTGTSVVQPTPIFIWSDLNADGTGTTPIKLPHVMGHAPLFSGQPVELSGGAAGGQPNWDTYWEIYDVVRPTGSQAFYPVVADPDDPTDTDVFASIRADRATFDPPPNCAGTMLPVSSAVSAIPNVARYAGRLALHPTCFCDDAAAVMAIGPSAAEPTDGGTTDGGTPDAGMPPAGPSQSVAWAATCGFLDSQAAIEAAVIADNIIDTQTTSLCPLMLWTSPQP